jgi:hypothetical protein
MARLNRRRAPPHLISVDQAAGVRPAETRHVRRIELLPGKLRPGNRLPGVAVSIAALPHPERAPRVPAGRQAASRSGEAITAPSAAGPSDPAHLGVRAVSSSAAAGARSLAHRSRAAPGVGVAAAA